MLDSHPRSSGHYQMDTLIGRGGMGEVWKGRALLGPGLSKTVAFKRVRASLAGDPALACQLAREVEATLGLRHPNIVYVFDFAQIQGRDCMVMEWIEGVNLAQMARHLWSTQDRVFAPNEIQHIAISVLSALDYAHQARSLAPKRFALVHRDISPQNILISTLGEVKVSDFGIARPMDAGEFERGWHGKRDYVAPEQHTSCYDHRVDLYALGVVLYELVTKKVFRIDEMPNDPLAASARVVETMITALGNPAQAQVVAKLLAKRPQDRFPSARAALDALVEESGLHPFQGSVTLGEHATGILGSIERSHRGFAHLSPRDALAVSREATTHRGVRSRCKRGVPGSVRHQDLPGWLKSRMDAVREFVSMWSSLLLFAGGFFNVPKCFSSIEPAVTEYESRLGLSPFSTISELAVALIWHPFNALVTQSPGTPMPELNPPIQDCAEPLRSFEPPWEGEEAYRYWHGGVCDPGPAQGAQDSCS